MRVWDLHFAANDIDLCVEWSKASVLGVTNAHCARSRSAGMIALRPERDGRISGYRGIATRGSAR